MKKNNMVIGVILIHLGILALGLGVVFVLEWVIDKYMNNGK